MNVFYYLRNCSTCKRIITELNIKNPIKFRNLKNNPLHEKELVFLKSLSGSYESLFSKKAQLYKKWNLKEKTLLERDYKNLILKHYTFLKRPVLILKNKIFIGNSPKIIEQAKLILNG
mgnify:FL=1